MRVTIKDVAQASGYSTATVSMVLNNKDVRISARTREKIWDTARELDYHPNQVAVSLIKKATKVLGLIIPDNCNSFMAEISKTIEVEAHNNGFNLIYGNTSNDPVKDLEYLRMFEEQQVEGIIYVRSSYRGYKNAEARIEQFIGKSPVPVIVFDRKLPEDWRGSFNSVLLNNFRGGYIVTRHLLDQGHVRIGAYTGPLDLTNSTERLRGYSAALEERGIPFDQKLVLEGSFSMNDKDNALDYFLDKKATAVFCFNDLMAAEIYKEMRIKNLNIPNDLSIVGFDNSSIGEILYPELTSVAHPIEAMCASAISLLLDEVGDNTLKNSTQTILFEPELIIRRSTCSSAV